MARMGYANRIRAVPTDLPPERGRIMSGSNVRERQLSQTICVLEDDPDISRLVQHHLEAAGFGVRLYSTPTNLVPDSERQAPVLFLLDIMVTGGAGPDEFRRPR